MNNIGLAIDIGMLSSIVSIVLIGLTFGFAAFLLIGALLGVKRGLLHSLLRLAAVVVAMGLSIAGSFALRDTAAGIINEKLRQFIEDPSFTELMENSPTLAALVEDFPVAVAGPFVFFGLFVVLNLILYIVYKILKHLTVFGKILFSKTLFGKLQLGRGLGAIVSALASFLILLCFMTPLAGYVTLADDVVAELANVEALDADTLTTLEVVHQDVTTPLSENTLIKTTNALMSKTVFEPLSTFSINGEKVSVKKEAAYLASTYATVTPLIRVEFDFTQFGKTEAAALRKFAADFNNSYIFPHVIAEVIPVAADAWANDGEFFGIPNPTSEVPENLQEMMGHILTIMQTTSYDTLQGDLSTILELLAILSENGTMQAIGESEGAKDIVNCLSEPGLISGLIDVLYENERTRILVADLANLGFNAIGESLEISKNDEEIRAHLTADLNDAIKNAEVLEGYDNQVSALSFDIKHLFAKYGMEAGEEEAKLYAECIIGIGPITSNNPEDAVEEYFNVISAAVAGAGPVQPVSSVPVNENVQKALSAYIEYHGTEKLDVVLSTSNQINGNADLIHAMITLDRILLSAEEIDDMTHDDFLKQAKALEDVIILLGDVIVEDEEGGFTIDALNIDTAALSAALHDLADTRTDSVGKELHNFATALTNLIKFALQKAGIDALAASNLIDYVLSTEPDENGNRKDTLSTAFVVVDIIGKEDATKEDIMNGVSSLVENLDTDSAKVLADCISPNLINNFSGGGLGTERTEALVNVTHDLLENFGEHADELSPEQLEAETAYMQTIFELGMSAGDAKADDLFTTDENGEAALGQTATEFVDVIAHSTIISETFIEEKEDMKVAINDKMSDSDKEVLAEALLNDEALSPELKDALTYAFGIEVPAE